MSQIVDDLEAAVNKVNEQVARLQPLLANGLQDPDDTARIQAATNELNAIGDLIKNQLDPLEPVTAP
jgi:hypothetical protein